MGRNKWVVKNKFEPLMNHIREKRHLMSHFTVDEMVEVISG